ncbi:pectate lyase [Pseudomonas sp. KFB-139]|uniref:pectate lyase n=1 Tax=Pseudomonas serbiensis TaxID=3064350 RepID=A0ABT9CM71_9PSED|nr:pectate lyase [Pseudomonas sp. KFB-138]MDO7925221.1 pectate lyase [Pseudomonas sp. KFB-138]
MSDIAGISGFSQNGLSGLSGLSGGLGGAAAGAATGQGGQSPLEQLAGMLAEMLLGSGSGSGGAGAGAGSGSGAGQAGKSGQSDIDSLLQSLQGGEQKDGSSKGANGTGDESSKELLTQVLMALFEKILGGSDSSSGTGEGGGNGSGSGSGSPVSGAGGTGGGGTKGLEGLGSNQGLGGAQGAGGGSGSVEDLVNTLMKSLGGGSLDNSIQPTSDGGGQVSQDGKLKELLEMIAQFMDSHPETFNQPSDSSSKGTGGGGGGGGGSPAPSVGGGGGGGAPAPAVAGGGGGGSPAPSVGGGGGGGGAPAPSVGGGGGGGTPSVGGGGGGSTPSIGGTTPTPTPGTGSPAGTGAAGSSTPVSFPTASGSPTVVNETIKVGPGEVFDGQGKTFTAGPSLGDGGQGEGQKPMFELAEGATLKNVTFGDNAADGVHVRAGNEKAVNVDNVHWTNVGEDALTVKGEGGAKVTNLNITNSSAQGASDKIFQLNADANVSVDNFKAKDFGTFMRTNGGQQGNWNLDLKNIEAENGKFSFVKSDSEGLNLTTSGINLKNVEHPYDKLPGSTNHKEV